MDGWIQKVLHRHNIVGLRANEVGEQEAEETMALFRKELQYLMSTWNVDPERVFNAGQLRFAVPTSANGAFKPVQLSDTHTIKLNRAFSLMILLPRTVSAMYLLQ